MSDNLVSRNRKSTSMTAIAMGLESLSFLITNETLRKICVIISPAVALIGVIIFKNFHLYIESQRGLKAYQTMIIDLEKDLLKSDLSPEERKEIQSEIHNCKSQIRKIKVDSIKIIVDH